MEPVSICSEPIVIAMKQKLQIFDIAMARPKQQICDLSKDCPLDRVSHYLGKVCLAFSCYGITCLYLCKTLFVLPSKKSTKLPDTTKPKLFLWFSLVIHIAFDLQILHCLLRKKKQCIV